MPRSSGIYSPPGASFPATAGSLIESAKFNNIINDIGSALTTSIATDGTSAVTGNISMGNNKVTNLAIGTVSGDAIRNSQISRGSDINVTASGLQTVPSDGGNFVMTTAASFNITGFSSSTFTGRVFSIKFPTNFSMNLINSATFKLRDGVSRATIKGETAFFILQSVGVFEEITNQSLIDLTGYAGADIALGINQTAYYDISAVTTLALRIATGDNQTYQINYNPTKIAGSAVVGTATALRMNNALLGASFVSMMGYHSAAGVGATAQAGVLSQQGEIILSLNPGVTDVGFQASVNTRTLGKTGFSNWLCISSTTNYAGFTNTFCTDTTTAWTSLGIINFPFATTGRMMVKRVL